MKTTSTGSPQLGKSVGGRFRFPFLTKSTPIPTTTQSVPPASPPKFLIPLTNSTKSTIPSMPLDQTPSTSPLLWNLRKLGSKDIKPRKAVSFSPEKTGSSAVLTNDMNEDHTDVNYREAVSKLRNILSPRSKDKNVYGDLNPEGIGVQVPNNLNGSLTKNTQDSSPSKSILKRKLCEGSSEGNLFGFIQKQSEYINQLEKDTKASREDLGKMLEKVKDVLAENESLHEKQKRNEVLNKIVQDLEGNQKLPLTNGNLSGVKVLEDSRMAELEAQVLQLKKGLPQQRFQASLKALSPDARSCFDCQLHLNNIQDLIKERKAFEETISKSKMTINEFKNRETEMNHKIKSGLDKIELIKSEKILTEEENSRLKDELEKSHERLRSSIQESSRKLQDEKLQLEKKFNQEIHLLNHEISVENDNLTKTKLELERQKRIEAELRREVQLRSGTIEDLRVEMQIRINHLQTELAHALNQKCSAEQDLINCRLGLEKIERDGKQECSKLQTELNLTRRRLEDIESEWRKSQDAVVKLNENLNQLQKETSRAQLRLEGHLNSENGDVASILQGVRDSKGKDSMGELERLIQVQNDFLDKLREDSRNLADRLEETKIEQRQEKELWEGEKRGLLELQQLIQEKSVDLEERVRFYGQSHNGMTRRLEVLEEEDKLRSQKILSLLNEQSGVMKDNERLETEVVYLKQRLGERTR